MLNLVQFGTEEDFLLNPELPVSMPEPSMQQSE
jgi:hypothetical protein